MIHCRGHNTCSPYVSHTVLLYLYLVKDSGTNIVLPVVDMKEISLVMGLLNHFLILLNHLLISHLV